MTDDRIDIPFGGRDLERVFHAQVISVKRILHNRHYYNVVFADGKEVSKTRWNQQYDKEHARRSAERVKRDYEEAYEVTAQSHYEDSNRGTNFDYTLRGTFQNLPSEYKLESFTRNTLLSKFYSGKRKTASLGKAVHPIVEGAIRGFQVDKVVIKKGSADNRFDGQLIIKSKSGNTWTSK